MTRALECIIHAWIAGNNIHPGRLYGTRAPTKSLSRLFPSARELLTHAPLAKQASKKRGNFNTESAQ
jgi:hypothetical protein